MCIKNISSPIVHYDVKHRLGSDEEWEDDSAQSRRYNSNNSRQDYLATELEAGNYEGTE